MKRIKSLHKDLSIKYHVTPILTELKHHACGKLVDIGCGDKPFFKHLKDRVEEYIGVDHPDTMHSKSAIDTLASVYNMPFKNNTFDTAILTQVIEHLEDPENALIEINRIMKPGGKLFISWPFLYPIHEAPRDFYRYTKFGMEHLAKKTGFDIIKLKSSSGFWITLFGFISKYLYDKSAFVYILLYPFLFLLKIICLSLNFFDKNLESYDRWTWNYYGVLKKQENE